MSMTPLNFTRPDDCNLHLHLRAGELHRRALVAAAKGNNGDSMTLEKQRWTVPGTIRFGHQTGLPLRTGEDDYVATH
jgi:dihydroorotase